MATTPLESFADLRSALGMTAPVEKPIVGTVESPPPAAAETKPATETPAEPTPVVTDAAAPAAEETKPAAKTEEPPAPVPEKKPKRFSELTRQLEEERATRARIEAELATLRAKPVTPGTPTPATSAETSDLPGKPVKPKFEDWKDKTWEEFEAAKESYQDALVDWKVANVRHREEQQARVAADKAAWQQVDETWKQQYDREMEADESFESKVAAVAKVVAPRGLVEVIKESPVAAEIVKALHADADKLAAIAKMSVASAAREIGKIEARIQGKTAPATTARPLPNPPQAIGGTGDNTPKVTPLADLPMSEFKKAAKLSLKPGTVGVSARRMTVGK